MAVWLLTVVLLGASGGLPCLEGPENAAETCAPEDGVDDLIRTVGRIGTLSLPYGIGWLIAAGTGVAFGVVMVGAACAGLAFPAAYIVAVMAAVAEIALVHGVLGAAAIGAWFSSGRLGRTETVTAPGPRLRAAGMALGAAWLTSLGIVIGGLGTTLGTAFSATAFYWLPTQDAPPVAPCLCLDLFPPLMVGGVMAGILVTSALAAAVMASGHIMAGLVAWELMTGRAPAEVPHAEVPPVAETS